MPLFGYLEVQEHPDKARLCACRNSGLAAAAQAASDPDICAHSGLGFPESPVAMLTKNRVRKPDLALFVFGTGSHHGTMTGPFGIGLVVTIALCKPEQDAWIPQLLPICTGPPTFPFS